MTLIYTFYKSPNRRKSLVLLLNYAGFAYIFEYFIVSLFNGYVYKPHLFKRKQTDNIFGAICSQFFYVPVTALFITTFNLNWKIKLLFSSSFALIEKMFIYLGIFKSNWWRTKYTLMLIFTSFYVNDLWSKLLSKKIPAILFITLFNLVQVTWINLIFLSVALRKIRYGFPPFLSLKEHFRLGPLIGFIISFFFVCWLKTGGFIANLKNLLTMSLIDLVLFKKGYLKIKNKFVLPILYLNMIVASNYFRTWVYKP